MEKKSIHQMYEEIARIERKEFYAALEKAGGEVKFDEDDDELWVAAYCWGMPMDVRVLGITSENGFVSLQVRQKDSLSTENICVSDVMYGHLDEITSNIK